METLSHTMIPPQRPKRCYKHFLCLQHRLELTTFIVMKKFSDAALNVSLSSLDMSFRVCICVLCTQICHISSGDSHEALAQGYSLSSDTLLTAASDLCVCMKRRKRVRSQLRLFLSLQKCDVVFIFWRSLDKFRLLCG